MAIPDKYSRALRELVATLDDGDLIFVVDDDTDPGADTDPDPRPPAHTPPHGLTLSAPLADSQYRPR